MSMNVGAKTFDRLEGMGLKMIARGRQALARTGEGHGRVPWPGADRSGRLGVDGQGHAFDQRDQGRGAAEARSRRAWRCSAPWAEARAPRGIYKELKVDPAAQTHQGLTFTHVSATIDMEKLAEMSGNNPGQLETMKAIFGDGRMNVWYGTDGKRILKVAAPKWEEARALIDAYLKGDGGVGQTAGFKAVVSELPGRASFLMLFSTQGIVRMMANQFATISKNADLKVPEDMPKEPAYWAPP